MGNHLSHGITKTPKNTSRHSLGSDRRSFQMSFIPLHKRRRRRRFGGSSSCRCHSFRGKGGCLDSGSHESFQRRFRHHSSCRPGSRMFTEPSSHSNTDGATTGRQTTSHQYVGSHHFVFVVCPFCDEFTRIVFYPTFGQKYEGKDETINSHCQPRRRWWGKFVFVMDQKEQVLELHIFLDHILSQQNLVFSGSSKANIR